MSNTPGVLTTGRHLTKILPAAALIVFGKIYGRTVFTIIPQKLGYSNQMPSFSSVAGNPKRLLQHTAALGGNGTIPSDSDKLRTVLLYIFAALTYRGCLHATGSKAPSIRTLFFILLMYWCKEK